ncbi:single-stranded DNA-binding protein [Tsukamurella sp. 8F]|uniref:single-stranded DNA-binding protein n=1 Tax=unclassified Tsukamurella TaxID=2633480 RepID=UPI0023B8A7FE|nr:MULTISPECIES: single-stranded DNA-binding protein [unclassified Tsukamurella]MDF0529657.1 single-stranded DNA-binding protein [Tsukamurella sp. 8J]MDF0585942.1 single-stranded DNA-binding protein [Tsukamurella sp. 8F]
MPGAFIYATGKVTNDFTFRQSQKDERHDFLTFQMAHNNGYYTDNGTWETTSTLWLTVKAFGALARNARGAVAKGRPVMVHGELRHESFTGVDGQRRSLLELRADAIGLNLRSCGAEYTGTGSRSRDLPQAGETPVAATGTDGALAANGGSPRLAVVGTGTSDGDGDPGAAEPPTDDEPPF